jgi:hypothetical protein
MKIKNPGLLKRTLKQEGLIHTWLILLHRRLGRYFQEKNKNINIEKPVDRPIIRTIKQEGPFQGLLLVLLNWILIYYRNSQQRYDRKYCVETAKLIDPFQQAWEGDNREESVWYYPSAPSVLQCIYKYLKIDYRNFVFIDVGSGKGRVLLYASGFPFKRIIGVESSVTTCEIAKRNVNIYNSSSKKSKNIEIINSDILNVRFPNENTVFYLYNPFILSSSMYYKFLRKLELSIKKHPRRIFVVYSNPESHEIFKQFDFIREITDYSVLLPHHSWRLYENNSEKNRGAKIPKNAKAIEEGEGSFRF